MNMVEMLGTVAPLSSESVSLKDKQKLLDNYAEHYEWDNIFLTDADGKSLFQDDINISDRDYFKTAAAGTTSMSDPIYTKDTGELVLTMAAPLWELGVRDGKVVGTVVISMSADQLTDVVSGIKVSDNSGAYIINQAGVTVAHTDYQLVQDESNTIEESKTDSSLKASTRGVCG